MWLVHKPNLKVGFQTYMFLHLYFFKGHFALDYFYYFLMSIIYQTVFLPIINLSS